MQMHTCVLGPFNEDKVLSQSCSCPDAVRHHSAGLSHLLKQLLPLYCDCKSAPWLQSTFLGLTGILQQSNTECRAWAGNSNCFSAVVFVMRPVVRLSGGHW